MDEVEEPNNDHASDQEEEKSIDNNGTPQVDTSPKITAKIVQFLPFQL
jgi:hypothetical protein